MALNITQQFNELIDKANSVLICLPKDLSIDAVGSGLAMVEYLKKVNKKVAIVADEFDLPSKLKFLSGAEEIASELTNLRQFIIEVDLANKKVDEFSYDVLDEAGEGAKNKKLKIFILPQQGELAEKDVKFNVGAYRFDTIICLDTVDLESLGKIFFEQNDFFFNTTIINIDNQLSNENYGQLNLINPNKSSVAEIVFELLMASDESLIDEKMATALLAGMIHKTGSFKRLATAPQTFKNASRLMTLGAEREKIIKNFYQSQSLASLKLWGRALARLQYDAELKLAWTSLPQIDFVKSGARVEDLSGVVRELIANSPQAEMILLIFEKANGEIGGQLYSKPNIDSKYLLNNFEVEGNKNFVKFNIKDKKLKEVEGEMVREIRGKLII